MQHSGDTKNSRAGVLPQQVESSVPSSLTPLVERLLKVASCSSCAFLPDMDSQAVAMCEFMDSFPCIWLINP